MKVTTLLYTYTIYVTMSGEWTMHVWTNTSREDGSSLVETLYNVSALDPFASRVEYDAWR